MPGVIVAPGPSLVKGVLHLTTHFPTVVERGEGATQWHWADLIWQSSSATDENLIEQILSV